MGSQIDHIRRTVTGAPEVMITVTGSGGSTSLHDVIAHFSYIGRHGELEVETDDGQRLTGRTAAQSLFNDWDLDLQMDRRRNALLPLTGGSHPSSFTRLSSPCPPIRLLKRCYQPSAISFGKNSEPGTAT
jgi:hypothetical protein